MMIFGRLQFLKCDKGFDAPHSLQHLEYVNISGGVSDLTLILNIILVIVYAVSS